MHGMYCYNSCRKLLSTKLTKLMTIMCGCGWVQEQVPLVMMKALYTILNIVVGENVVHYVFLFLLGSQSEASEVESRPCRRVPGGGWLRHQHLLSAGPSVGAGAFPPPGALQ